VAGDSNAIGGACLSSRVVLLWVLCWLSASRRRLSDGRSTFPTLDGKAKLNTNRHRRFKSLPVGSLEQQSNQLFRSFWGGKLRDCCVFEMFRSLCVQGGRAMAGLLAVFAAFGTGDPG